MMVETFGEQRDSGRCAVKYYLLDHIGEEFLRFARLSIADSSAYKFLTVHIKQ